MANIQRRLDDRLTAAIRGVFPEAADAPAIVMQAQDERFGDYQANGAMALAKRLGKNPRDDAPRIDWQKGWTPRETDNAPAFGDA